LTDSCSQCQLVCQHDSPCHHHQRCYVVCMSGYRGTPRLSIKRRQRCVPAQACATAVPASGVRSMTIGGGGGSSRGKRCTISQRVPTETAPRQHALLRSGRRGSSSGDCSGSIPSAAAVVESRGTPYHNSGDATMVINHAAACVACSCIGCLLAGATRSKTCHTALDRAGLTAALPIALVRRTQVSCAHAAQAKPC